jgi:hypothetical protein
VDDWFFTKEKGMSTITTQKKGPSWSGSRQAAVAEVPGLSDEQIRRRAHEIYLARKGKPGDAMQDWLQAEKELRAKVTW